jgi:phosphatidylserine/phosphatidylglycerophosphate/cardiolipin synthase-like enzyme
MREGRSLASNVPDEDDQSVEPGAWRFARAERATVIVDAADYFAAMQSAMLNARKRIMLVGWDFDTRIHLALGRRWFSRPFRGRYPRRLGSFLMWLARHRQDLDIRVLKWGLGFVPFLMRGYMLVDVLRMSGYKNITFKFDNKHPIGCSHHQKIVVLDDRLAVCGGIDMTQDRWDTREHLEHDRRRRRRHGRLYGPWHDATMMVEGDAAHALGCLSRDRWHRAGGEELEEFSCPTGSLWPDGLPVQFENVEIGISRTRAKYHDCPEVREIERSLLDQIARARKFIYSENQYLTSPRIAEALAKRLREADPPEIVLVQPLVADGWLEQQAMDHARALLVQGLVELDHKKRFGLFNPFTGQTPIYVHAKLTIIDDEVLRIGSANFNNRSLGLDSECDMFIDCTRPGNAHACEPIRALRHSLVAEHCGLSEDEVTRALEANVSMLELVRARGQSNVRTLRPFPIPEPNELQKGMAESQVLDPEKPEDFFEPFAKGGLLKQGSMIKRAYDRAKRGMGR